MMRTFCVRTLELAYECSLARLALLSSHRDGAARARQRLRAEAPWPRPPPCRRSPASTPPSITSAPASCSKTARKTTPSSSSTSASFAIARFCWPSPTADPTADPAIFASLSQVIGKPINQYAFGDIPGLARTIDAVLAYDTANPDTFVHAGRFRQSSRRRSQWADGDENKDARRGGPHPCRPA